MDPPLQPSSGSGDGTDPTQVFPGNQHTGIPVNNLNWASLTPELTLLNLSGPFPTDNEIIKRNREQTFNPDCFERTNAARQQQHNDFQQAQLDLLEDEEMQEEQPMNLIELHGEGQGQVQFDGMASAEYPNPLADDGNNHGDRLLMPVDYTYSLEQWHGENFSNQGVEMNKWTELEDDILHENFAFPEGPAPLFVSSDNNDNLNAVFVPSVVPEESGERQFRQISSPESVTTHSSSWDNESISDITSIASEPRSPSGPKCRKIQNDNEKKRRNRGYTNKYAQNQKEDRKNAAEKKQSLLNKLHKLRKCNARKEKFARIAFSMYFSPQEVVEENKQYEAKKLNVKTQFVNIKLLDKDMKHADEQRQNAANEFEKAARAYTDKQGKLGTLGCQRSRAKQDSEHKNNLYETLVIKHEYRRERTLSNVANIFIVRAIPDPFKLLQPIPLEERNQMIQNEKLHEMEELRQFVREKQALFGDPTVAISENF